MTVPMDDTFALALRDLLVEQVQAPATKRGWLQPPKRWLARAGVLVAVAVAGGGIAYATGVFTVPGTNVVMSLAPPATVTGAGTETVKLGAPPAKANAIEVSLACLTAGDFRFADGAGIDCAAADARAETQATYSLPLAPGQDTTTITATPGARWRLTATYSDVTLSAWGINASGQTYGAANANGTPDLVAVIASNGRSGYVYANQLSGPPPMTPSQAVTENNSAPRTLAVYESDGTTPVGTFTTGTAGPTGSGTQGSRDHQLQDAPHP